ncbi:MAG: hypothetical protein ACTSRI_07055 [Promethearchaeota archaeon]
MARYYLFVLKIINGLIFIWILIIFLSIFNLDVVINTSEGELVIVEGIISTKNIFSYLIYALFFFVGLGIAFLITFLFSSIPLFQSNYMFNFINSFFKNYLNLWFTFPNGVAPNLGEIIPLIFEELLVFISYIYLFSFQVLLIISIIYAVRSIIKSDPKYNLISIGCLVLMIVIPLMVFGFKDMLSLFLLQFEYLEELPNPVNPKLTELPRNNFFSFLASSVAMLAIISYIYLELAFQINYTDTVTKPSLERSDRLESQLKVIRSESHFVIANVDKIKEEAKKRKEELGLEKEVIGKFLSRTTERFSYVKEMIERKKLEAEEKKLVSAASKTRRLGRYIERLFREDLEARDTLTAKSAAPRSRGLLISTVITFLFRMSLLIIISFIIIHPLWFFANVFFLPPAITKSVAMYSPEVVITLLIPLMLLFPVISQIISYIKHRNLIIRLKQEGRIKQILASVGDYVKVEEKGEGEEVPKEEGESAQVATETA